EGIESDNTPVNWGTASDPALDGGSRYAPQLIVNIGPEDYPPRARRANVNEVVVAVTVYLSGKTGRVRDFKVRGIRSENNAHEPFTNDFIEATRKILFVKTRMANKPYQKDGIGHDFVWDTAVKFTLQ
ncbi:MAG: hypothetical protein HY042_02955, partial [Spirochaetia bacterium]|nr:hypothetical protein [Spirochaetia bacterium]